MKRINPYKTKQKEELINYFRLYASKSVTVNDIVDYFKQHDIAIGNATIYRRLDKLVEEGIITKYNEGTTSFYEYLGEQCHKDLCIHCKCEVCGKIIHLHCDEFKRINSHLFNDHGFKMNMRRTILFGICENCV